MTGAGRGGKTAPFGDQEAIRGIPPQAVTTPALSRLPADVAHLFAEALAAVRGPFSLAPVSVAGPVSTHSPRSAHQLHRAISIRQGVCGTAYRYRSRRQPALCLWARLFAAPV